MAILTQQKSNSYDSYEIEELCPEVSFASKIVDMFEQLNVERKKYQSEETEVCDVTRFLFLVKTKKGFCHVQTNEMKISSFHKSRLFQFIENVMGAAPGPNFDTAQLVGQACQITGKHTVSMKGNTYTQVTSVSPLMDGVEGPAGNELAIPGGSRSGVDLSESTPVEEEDESPF